MINHDYTKEICVDSGEKIVPWRYAVLLLAVIAIGAWFGVKSLMNHTTLEHRTHESTQLPATPAPAPKP